MLLFQVRRLGSLEGCHALRSLFASHNRMKNVEGLGHIGSLEEVDLSHNDIQSEIGVRLLSLNVRLHTLDLRHNPVVDERPRMARAKITAMLSQLDLLDGEKLPPSATQKAARRAHRPQRASSGPSGVRSGAARNGAATGGGAANNPPEAPSGALALADVARSQRRSNRRLSGASGRNPSRPLRALSAPRGRHPYSGGNNPVLATSRSTSPLRPATPSGRQGEGGNRPSPIMLVGGLFPQQDEESDYQREQRDNDDLPYDDDDDFTMSAIGGETKIQGTGQPRNGSAEDPPLGKVARSLLRHIRLELKRRRISQLDFFRTLDSDSSGKVTRRQWLDGLETLAIEEEDGMGEAAAIELYIFLDKVCLLHISVYFQSMFSVKV